MKAKTGLQHLTVINQSHQQYLQKTCRIYISISPPSCEGYAADHLARLMEQEGISRYLVSVGVLWIAVVMNGEGQPWRGSDSKPTDKENAVQAVVDINGHALAPLAATVTITNWTANVFLMLSIRKPGVLSNTIWYP